MSWYDRDDAARRDAETQAVVDSAHRARLDARAAIRENYRAADARLGKLSGR